VTSQNLPQPLVSKKCDLADSIGSDLTSIELLFACIAGVIHEAVKGISNFLEFIVCSTCLRRALSPTFRAGGMVFFIPWRVVAEESGAAHLGFGGAMLLDLLGPALRLLTDSPISTLVIFRFGATMELGRDRR
jgi:hypothetical protein